MILTNYNDRKVWNTVYAKLNLSKNKYAFFEGTYGFSDPTTRGKIARLLPLSRVGWAKRAVEMRANKTHFDKFENDTLKFNDLFKKYRVIEALDKIKEDVLISGVGFLVKADDRVMPFTALEATGTYDWREQNLSEGIAVFREASKRNLVNRPDSFMHFTRNFTGTFENGEYHWQENKTGRPLMVLLTHKGKTKQPFGRSVISRPARDAMVDASRTVRQAMVAAHHYNSKVDVILGADTETEIEKVESKTGDVLKIGPNENGQIPQVAELAQHAMAPFNDTILMAARNFCSDTKLSLANLSIVSNAPQSAEALEIVGDDLRDDIEEWQREMGEQLKYFATTLWMVENEVDEIDENLQAKIDATLPVWEPVFRADVSKFGDGLTKIAENAPHIVKARSIWRNLGLSSDEIDMVIASADQNMLFNGGKE